jgi:hypothetical protein
VTRVTGSRIFGGVRSDVAGAGEGEGRDRQDWRRYGLWSALGSVSPGSAAGFGSDVMSEEKSSVTRS